jgi:hypothetical protein
MLARSSAVRFLIGTSLVLVVGFGLVVASFRLQFGHHTIDSAGRCRSVDEKVELGLNLRSPKIVFIGGSSVHWGINAEEAGKTLRREGLNFGTFAALGPQVILWKARQVLEPGDIAVLAFEYSMYGERSLTTDAISYALGCAQDFLYAMSPSEFVKTALASDPSRPLHVLRWGLRAGNSSTKGIAEAPEKSDHGDPIATSFRSVRLAELQERVKLYQPLRIRVEEDGMLTRAVDTFNRWAIENDVQVFATWPNTISFDAYKDDPAFDQIRELYAHHGIHVLGAPQGAMYPAELFHDTQYHLAGAGIKRRTRDLLAVLKDQLHDGPSVQRPTMSVAAKDGIGNANERSDAEALPN